MVAHAIAHQYVRHHCPMHKYLMDNDDCAAFKLNYQQKIANAMAISAPFMTFLIGEMSC